MSAFSAAASDEDGDIINSLKGQLGRANALCRIRLDRIRELEAMLYAFGAGGVGKMEQPQDHAEQYLGMVPPGWKLVPVKPTRDMLTAWIKAAVVSNTTAPALYRAMLAAAPQPPVVEQEPVLVVEKEPDYMSRGHFYEGSRPHINPMKVLKLPIGTKLYTHPQPRQPLTDEQIYIIKLAFEAGWGNVVSMPHIQALERFAAGVAAVEREFCAQVCDEASKPRENYAQTDEQRAAAVLAERIRAKGEA